MAELRTHGGCTKTALAKILRTLHSRGVLGEGIGEGSERAVRGRIRQDVESTASQMTPFGRLIRTMPSGYDGMPEIEYVDPCALLWTVTNMSNSFWSLLNRPGQTPFRLVLYIDEICPGNPLRPQPTRLCQCIYWSFADLPSNILVQSGMWFLFCVLRTQVATEIAGKLSGLIKRILYVFFPRIGHSLHRGVLVGHGQDSKVVSAIFRGFIGDEKALKEILGIKGASGKKPCPTCSNLVRLVRPEDRAGTSLVGLECTDYSQLEYHTDESFFGLLDRLRDLKNGGSSKAAIKNMEIIFGMHYDEDNLLYDPYMRTIVSPTKHVYRDWMHSLVSNGVAGHEMTFLFLALNEIGIKNSMLQEFAMRFTLPKAHGTVGPGWFLPDRIGPDQLKSFASEQLNMIPLVQAFLDDVIAPTGQLTDHRKCFRLLYVIVSILCKGPAKSMRHIGELQRSIIEHGDLYAKLYPKVVKPKFHQLLHIPEQMADMGSLLSCFPLERKHRSVKSVALHVYRNFEHTVLNDLITQQLAKLQDDSLYGEMALQSPQEVRCDGVVLLRATGARLPCCEVRAGDIILHSGDHVAEVECFWGVDDIIFAQASPFTRTPEVHSYARQNTTAFIDASTIECPLMWTVRSPGVFKVCWPVVR